MDSKTLIIICLFVIGNIAISMTNQSSSGDRLEEFQHDNNASPPPTSIKLDVNNQWDTMLNIRDMQVTDSGDIFVVGTIKARSYDYHFSSIGTIYIPGDGYEAFAGKMNSIGEWDWILLAPDHQTTSFLSVDVHDSLGVFIGGLSQTGSGSSFMFDVYTTGGEMTPSNPTSTSASRTIDPSQMILWVTHAGVINEQWYGGGEFPTIGSIRDVIVDGSELHAVGMLGPSETMNGSAGDASMQNSHSSHVGVMARFSIAENTIDMKWSEMLCDAANAESPCMGQYVVEQFAMDDSTSNFVLSGWYSGSVRFYDSTGTEIMLSGTGLPSGFLVTYESDVGVSRASSVSTDNADAIYAISYNDGNIAVSAKLSGSDTILAPNFEGSAVIIFDDATLSSNTSSIHRYTVSNSSGAYVEFFDAQFLSSGNVLVASKVYAEVQVGSSSYDLDQNSAIVVSELDSQGNWINSVLTNVEVDTDSSSLSHQLSIDSNDQFVIHIESLDDLHVFTRMTMDIDSDGISDSDDNCMTNYNPDQTDTDLDQRGDICDDDDDDDGVLDGEDECQLTSGSTANSGCPAVTITGCMDGTANNYNPSANSGNNTLLCDYDLDNDGVLDSEDTCMGVAGNQTNGCPETTVTGCNDSTANNYDSHVNTNDGSCDYDFDDDGVNDTSDVCPYVSGTDENGNPTNDGCPPIPISGCTYSNATNYNPNATSDDGSCQFVFNIDDVDGDFIADVEDECPSNVEDHDGFEDEDGCPDPDNDGDNVTDENDACPNVAADTSDGCPPTCEVCSENNSTQELQSEDNFTNVSDLLDDILDGEYNNEITAGGAGVGIGGFIANRLPKIRGRKPSVDIGKIADAKDTYDLIAGAGSKKTAKSIPKKLASDHYMKEGFDRFQSLVDSASPEATEYISDNSDDRG